jgi:multiple sugar transport system ATP-binding protein
MRALEISGLRKSFGALEVLKGIDLSLETGGFLVLLGPSGCGKSTLLAIIAGIEEASSGEIRIGGKRADHLHPKDRDIAMVFQSYALYPSMRVERNMAFGLEMRGVDADTRRGKVDATAGLLGIGALLGRKPAELSGGQRQRVAMGRALVRDPRLFLLDEPLSNLDAKLRTKMRGEIKRLHQTLEASIVYVTHDQVEAMTLASTIVIMRDGEIQQVGAPMEIYDRPANMFVAGFIGAPPMNFVDAVHQGGGMFTIEGRDDAVALPDFRDYAKDAPAVLGIRPEEFSIRRGDAMPPGVLSFETTPELIEPMGADTLVTFTIGARELQARVGGKEDLGVGEPLSLSCSVEAVRIFDPSSEAAISR